MRELLWFWQISREVCNDQPLRSHWSSTLYNQLRVQKNRLLFIAKAVQFRSSLEAFLYAPEGSIINRLIAQRPETVGAIVWPYQCNLWDAKTRLKQIEEHYYVIEKFFPLLDFHVNGALKFADLGDTYEDFHVVIDRPKWFMREGQLVINLFIGNVRIFSLAFSFARQSGNIVAYVGALQGRDIDGILDTYKKITKAMHGMRPQDFLVELFRTLCRTAGVSKIFAVSDSCRHHRSSYFGVAKSFAPTGLNYDRTWLERGGTLETPNFFVLGVETQLKAMEEIPSHKRSMYRRRYKLLEDIEVQVRDTYAHPENKLFLEYPFHSL